MNTKLTAIAMLTGALLLPVAGHASEADANSDRSSPKTFVKDSVITAKIKAKMAQDKQVSALSVKVDTDNKGVVTLSGEAKSKAEAAKAVSIARSVKGVVAVKNHIQIASNR